MCHTFTFAEKKGLFLLTLCVYLFGIAIGTIVAGQSVFYGPMAKSCFNAEWTGLYFHQILHIGMCNIMCDYLKNGEFRRCVS